MRIPVKSERDAFLLAYGIAAVVGAAVVLGVVAGALYGLVLFAGVVIGALSVGAAQQGPGPSTARPRGRGGCAGPTPHAIGCS